MLYSGVKMLNIQNRAFLYLIQKWTLKSTPSSFSLFHAWRPPCRFQWPDDCIQAWSRLLTSMNGISMGSPLGPFMANIFVEFHERQLFDKVSKPYCYFCYVVDTFSSHNEAEIFFQHLNSFHPLSIIHDVGGAFYNSWCRWKIICYPSWMCWLRPPPHFFSHQHIHETHFYLVGSQLGFLCF